MSPTAARPVSAQGAHWYYTDGRPCHYLPKADGKGTKKTTLADARKLNLMPSVTTILKVLDKPALTNWLIEQAVLAVLTSPRKPDEPMDAFVERIIHTEAVQDQERQQAADRGKAIHSAMELIFSGQREQVPVEILPWVTPAANEIARRGEFVTAERVLCGDDYAGCTDLVLRSPECWHLWDWKSSKTFPEKSPWPEHKLQLSAYGRAWLDMLPPEERCRRVAVGNIYISTKNQGEFRILETEDWYITYEEGFRPLVRYWQWASGYKVHR